MTQTELAEYNMCARYFGMERAMYEPMARLLQWLQADEAGAAMLDRVRDLLLDERNVPAASAVLSRLRDHAVVFYPSDIACDSSDSARDPSDTDRDPSAPTHTTAEATTVIGYPVDTTQGTIQAEQVNLDQREYDLLLTPGLPATSVHIPEDGSLSPEAVGASFAEAVQLLSRLHRRTSIWFCESWLLDPNLERLESPDGNICRFMRRFAKFPVFSARPMIVERVFGWGADNLATADLPERTSLQRNLKRCLLSGGEMFDVGGVIAVQ